MRNRFTGARKALIVMAAAATLVVTTGVISVLAVHDQEFQLEGDVIASTTTNIGGLQNRDWDSLFDTAGAEKTLPANFTASGFDRDFLTKANGSFNTNDATTFATGSKDTLPISGWQCNFDHNVNSKIDVMNAYSAAYTDPDNGDQIVYFALERNSNNGDANVGFWFLQDDVNCDATNGTATFSGAHTDGDLLIVSAFTNGGSVSTIDVYRWDGGANGSLNPIPAAHGADCRGTGAGDTVCAAANTASITTPWLTSTAQDGPGHTLLTSDFFEGGLNLTQSGLGGKCFNVFIGDTRSSQSLTATIFDYARGAIGECDSDTVTVPKANDGTTNIGTPTIPGDPSDAAILVKDSATVTVTGVSDWDGDVTFHLCKVDSPALCDTGGVLVGATKTASDETPTVVSDAATVTAAGRYCWRADFHDPSDIGIPDSSDSRSSECFTVDPRQPTLVTQATSGPVDFGSKISDTVTLANTAHKPGTGGPAAGGGSINPTTLGGDATGNITLTAFGPDSCTTVAYGPVSIAASGNGDTGGAGTTFEFTPSSPGEYVFVASYAGDLPNTLGVAATACASQPSNEKVTVRTIPTEITTAPSYFPQDSATVTSSVLGNDLPANGTVTFSLYGAAGGNTALENCTAAGATGLVFGPDAHLTGAAAHSATVATNNTTFRVSATGTFYWLVTYAPGDTAHTGIQSNCTENINATITGDNGPGTAFP